MRLAPDDTGSNWWLVLQWAEAEGVWLAERDAYDVPWLARYRIVGPAE